MKNCRYDQGWNPMTVLLAAALFTLITPITGIAQDRYLARTYQSNVLPKDNFDIEIWNTLRMGKEGIGSPFDYGRILDQRLEFELGLGGNVQTSFYLNLSHSTLHVIDAPEFSTSTVVGFSNEWKWKLSDPIADGIGTALYGEVSVNGSEVELEGKLILDKRVGKSLFALNLTGEYELESEIENDEDEVEVELESETPIQLDLAYTYLFSPTFGLGIEARNHNEIKEGEWEHSAWFAGPTLYLASGRLFGILSVQPQIFNMKKEDGAGDLVLDEHEKVEARLLIGISL